MTTIAFDGKELAADSQATQNEQLRNTVVKIFKTENYIMAFSGNIDDGYMFKMILDEELKAKDCKFSNSFSAIVWTSDGDVNEWYASAIPVPVFDKYLAHGSGAAIALAAMHSGKTAREAVEIAKKLDIYTGGRVISYSWETIKKKGKKKKNESAESNNPQESVREVSGGSEPQGRVGRDSKEIHRLFTKTSS